MKNNSFYVVEEQHKESGKTFAYAQKVPNAYNLIGKFVPTSGFKLISVNACDTWKEAQKTADFWNEQARKKNNYAF